MFKLYINYKKVAKKVGMTPNGVRYALQTGKSSNRNMHNLADCFNMAIHELWFQNKTPATIVMENLLKNFKELNDVEF